jgi:uncharacterized Zn finger protein
MSRYDYDRYGYYSYFEESKPRETDQGIKAKSQRGEFVKNWWATRWIKALERLLDAGRLRRGRTYARKGQVLSIEESKNGIKARVQGSRATPYKVSLEIKPLSDEQWQQVLAVLADQALFTAQLLAGEMPQEIEAVFAQAGVSLFPGSREELVTACSCPDYANPCKHVAAVHYILGEQFDEDPFMLFRLRGRTAEQIMETIRAQAGPAEAEAEAELFTPLDETLAHFWQLGQPLNQLSPAIKAPLTPFPILKRLGQPSFLADDLIDRLGPAYQAITAMAIGTAFAAEEEEEEETLDGSP